MSSDIERIKEHLPLVDLVGHYVKLESSQRGHKACCPFHQEKTPSFHVSTDRNMYYCFGCGRGGDIITFIQEIEGLDFQGALKLLADKAGITLQGQRGNSKQEVNHKNRLYDLLEKVTRLYEINLRKHTEVVGYLLGRGLEKETLVSFRVGYALPGWSYVINYARQQGFTDQEIEATGLASVGKRGLIDRFRERIMFPICDTQGRVVGFSGRIFVTNESNTDPEKTAKYVNTAETELYHKSSVLYGFHLAKTALKSSGRALVVEGQMDLLAVHQAGTEGAVAISGTALTAEHVVLLQRFVQRVTLVLDGDSAGFAAMGRSLRVLIPAGITTDVVLLPEGSDPADIISNNKADWQKYLDSAQDYFSAWFDHATESKFSVAEIIDKVRMEIYPLLSLSTRAMYQDKVMQMIAQRIGVTVSAVREEFSQWHKNERVANRGAEESLVRKSSNAHDSRNTKEHLIGILAWQRQTSGKALELRPFLPELSEMIGFEKIQEIWISPENFNALASWAEITYQDEMHLSDHIYDVLQTLRLRELKKKLTVVKRQLGQPAEGGRDSLLDQVQVIAQHIAIIESNRSLSP